MFMCHVNFRSCGTLNLTNVWIPWVGERGQKWDSIVVTGRQAIRYEIIALASLLPACRKTSAVHRGLFSTMN